MNFTFQGRVFATPTAMTMIVDGQEVFSGIVGAGQPLDTQISLTTLTNFPPSSTLSASVSVTSGVMSAGPVWLLNDQGEPCSPDLRDNELINGVAPEWPATPVDPMPGGTPENPDWQNWFFEISAGETITFNIVTPEPPPVPTPPSNP